jgi:adenosylcobinamide kinase/adenosylcobinamide-phosphate guanylyltransferase
MIGDDAEMAARVARHRADRPATWDTVEAPLDIAGAVAANAGESRTVLVDCLTVWLGNLFWEMRECSAERVETAAQAEVERLAQASRVGRVIVVSNETGSGTVPDAALTRAFRDVQGLVNQWAAAAADEVILTVAGLPMWLKGGAR